MAINIKKGTEMMQIPVVPLVDTVFNLLIFFLVATQITQAERELPMPLPEASEAQPITAKPRELIVNIDERGNYYRASQNVTLAELERELKRAYANNPLHPGSVVIRADKGCRWQSVVAAMNCCRKAKFRDYRVTTREVPQPG
jgi:biopolymer transport protein ExbD